MIGDVSITFRSVDEANHPMVQRLASIVTRCRNGFPLSRVATDAYSLGKHRYVHDESVGGKSDA